MRPRRRSRPEEGAILVVVALLVTFAAMGAVLMTMNAASSNQRADTERHATRARHLARGALDVVQQRVADGFFRTSATSSYLIESFDQVKGLFEGTDTVTIGEHGISFSIRELDDPATGKTEEGLNAFFLPIEITTVADVPGAQSTARRMVVLTFVPVYQFAAFYDMNLEIWPGPAMVLNGPVHTNGDLYVGADTSISFDTNYIHAAGSFYQSRAYAPIPNSKPVMIRRWVEDPGSSSGPVEYVQMPTQAQMLAQGIATTNGFDSLFKGFDSDSDGLFLSADDEKPFAPRAIELFGPSSSTGGLTGGTLATGEHGVQRLALPQLSSKAPFVATEPGTGSFDYDPVTGEYSPSAHGDYVRGPYHEQAGLKILLAQDGTWTATDGNGFDVTSRLRGVVRLETVADVREKDSVRVAAIDLEALGASGEFPANGLLYVAAPGDTPLDGKRGFLLEGGAELAAPLTTISDNFVYVQGDYNTVEKKPAAVVADVVNLLSNAWNGSKTLTSGKPRASETTYNTAIVSGFRASEPGKYSGGFENMPRFHETWSGVRCNIAGSFVALWEPAYSHTYRDPSAYDPPDRHWAFDASFNDFSSLPPFTPFLLQFAGVAEY